MSVPPIFCCWPLVGGDVWSTIFLSIQILNLKTIYYYNCSYVYNLYTTRIWMTFEVNLICTNKGIPEVLFHHNDDQTCSLFLQYTKYITTTIKTNSIVQRAVVHITADMSLPPQCCPSSAITVFVVVATKMNISNTKRAKKSLFHRGRGHHIIRYSHKLCKRIIGHHNQ